MNNLLRKIIVSGAILALGATAFPALAAISAGCKADLTKCTSAELAEYIAELTAILTALQAQVATLQPTTPATGGYDVPAGFTFEKNLKLGMRDADVVNLKKVLDVEVADHAAWTGSNYFGARTKAAVVKFQKKYTADISAAAGYTIAASGFVGTGTRAKLNALLAGAPVVTPPVTLGTAAEITLSGTPVKDDLVYVVLKDATKTVLCNPNVYAASGDTAESLATKLATGMNYGINCDNYGTATAVGNKVTFVAKSGVTFSIDSSTSMTQTGSTLVISAVLTTVPPVTPPPAVISSVSPVSGATNVAVGANVTAAFSVDLDATTVNATTVKVVTGTTTVAGTVSYATTTKTITVDPTANLANSTIYTVTLTTGIKNASGAAALTADYSFSFTTVAAPAVAAGLTIALASDTPVAGNFPAGGSQIPFVKLNVSAGSSDVTVTAMNVYRGGLSSDNDISNVYLMDGSTVLATNLGLSSGKANFFASAGLFTVKAGVSRTITVAADISSTAGGHTYAFSVNAASDITASATVNGTFPISGNTFAAVSVSNPSLATLTVADITTGSSVNAGTNNFLAGQFSLVSANSAVSVKSIKLTESGTIIAASDLANIKLMNGTTPVGATVANLNADGTVVFDLSSNPLQITSGATVILSVYTDVVSGVSRNFRFTVQRSYDIVATDMTYNVGAGVTAALFPVQATQVSVNQGNLVIAKATSPVSHIAAGVTNAILSSFNFTASGEAIRITGITYSIGSYTSGAETAVWNNLKLVDDLGVQIGTVTTAGANTNTSKSVALTGLNYIIPVNTTRVLSVRADIVSSYAGNVVGSITSGTAQGYTSLAAITIGPYAGNTLSADATPFKATINNAIGAITTVFGASSVRVGSFSLSAGAAEGINVSSVTFTTGSDVLGKLQNLVVKYGVSQIGATQATLSNSTSYTFSPSGPISITRGYGIVIDVYADTVSGATSSAVVVQLTGAQGTGALTNVLRTVTGTTAGQTVTINAAGALTTALASPAVVSQQVSMGVTAVKLGSFKLTADNNESINITSVAVQSTSTRAQDIVNLRLMSGTTQYGQTVSGVAGATATTTITLTTPLNVPQNSYVALDVLADINTLTNGASSTDTTTIALGTVNYQGASSQAPASYATTVNSGATFTIYRTSMTPAIGPIFTTPSSPSDGVIVGQFNITAGANNDVILKSISISQSGSLIQASSSVALKVYGSDAPAALLGSTTEATSINTYAIALNSPTGWTVAKGTTQYLIVKADLGSALNLVPLTTSQDTYQISVQAAAWNDGTTDGIGINPTISTPIYGQASNF